MAKAYNYWESLSQRIREPLEAKNKRPNTTEIEIEFIKKYINSSSSVLDIGAGSGLVTNELMPLVSEIVAVEKFEGFSRFINKDPNLLVINADIVGFKMRKQFDMVLCTGVGQCLKKDEMEEIYASISQMLKPGGFFISRMHCGIDETIIVDDLSEEIGVKYYAEFRAKDEETKLIQSKGFSQVELFDFLPDEINVWDNSRHYYFVCQF